MSCLTYFYLTGFLTAKSEFQTRFETRLIYSHRRVSKGLHPDLLYPNDVRILELKDHTRNKFLDRMLRKGEAGGGRHDRNGGCDGHIRVRNDDNKNVPFGETCAMPDRHPIIVAKVGGLLSCHIPTNGFMVGGSMS